MVEDGIRLEIVTMEKQVCHLMVEWLDVPTQSGPTTIKYNHAALLAALQPGALRYRATAEEHIIIVGAGFMEVKGNEVEILAQSAERVEEIDVERALAARERAEARLAAPTEDLDTVRAHAALLRANARLRPFGK